MSQTVEERAMIAVAGVICIITIAAICVFSAAHSLKHYLRVK